MLNYLGTMEYNVDSVESFIYESNIFYQREKNLDYQSSQFINNI